MSIPLDSLYHYIEQTCQQIWQGRVIIYRFYPHGSKDLKYLEFLESTPSHKDTILSPAVFCNDQEPLNYAFYNQDTLAYDYDVSVFEKLKVGKKNLRDYPIEIWNHAVLLHSEQRSPNVESYQQDGFVTAYYWSHGIIARDWFRFSQHIDQQKKVHKTFLIYNRAWAGTREYRLKFIELLIDWQLIDHCNTTANPVDPDTGVHYLDHQFANPAWRPTKSIENAFATNTSCSTYSARFEIKDYETTDIEVVLETLFDDTRWHLTEKSLRPIALAQPFILIGTAGSLEYLRSYGFKTFDTVWSEAYDRITDPALRLEIIAGIMKTIATWDSETRQQRMQQAQAIADFNRQHFFSSEFFDQLQTELKNNLGLAFGQLQHLQEWFGFDPKCYEHLDVIGTRLDAQLTQEQWSQLVQTARDFSKS
jgi:hypothetical protein